MPKFWGITGPKSAKYTLKWAAAEFQEFLPRWAAEFDKRRRGIWQNLPRKTVGPTIHILTVTLDEKPQYLFTGSSSSNQMAVLCGMPTIQHSVWSARLTAYKMFTSCIRWCLVSRTCEVWLCDVSVICRVTYLHFPIHACFSSMSVIQAAQ